VLDCQHNRPVEMTALFFGYAFIGAFASFPARDPCGIAFKRRGNNKNKDER